MKDNIEDRKCCFSSIIDPIVSPATAAVEKLKFFPENEFKHLRLLSERDETYFHSLPDCYDSDMNYQLDTPCDCGPFDMTPLSRISESISRGCGESIIANTNGCGTLLSSSEQVSLKIAKSLYSNRRTRSSHDDFRKKQRRLVACIAWDSQLAQLDSSSPSVTVHERGCSTVSHFNSKKIE